MALLCLVHFSDPASLTRPSILQLKYYLYMDTRVTVLTRVLHASRKKSIFDLNLRLPTSQDLSPDHEKRSKIGQFNQKR